MVGKEQAGKKVADSYCTIVQWGNELKNERQIHHQHLYNDKAKQSKAE